MKLFEYQGKQLLEAAGIPVPRAVLVERVDDLDTRAATFPPPVMVKAQTLQGGRGKAGGIRRVDTRDRIGPVAGALLGETIGDETVAAVLIEECISAQAELYLGITIDDVAGTPLVVASSRGGMDVEALSATGPASVSRNPVPVLEGLPLHRSVEIVRGIGCRGKSLTRTAAVLNRLYAFFIEHDAQLVEINPLIIDEHQRPWACDAKVVINDDALYRHARMASFIPRVEQASENELERRAKEKGFIYVDLKGEIAVMSAGAGYGMMIQDAIHHFGGTTANFMDAKGGVSPELIQEMSALAFQKAARDPAVRAVLMSWCITATPLESVVRGIEAALHAGPPDVPVLVCIYSDGASNLNMSREQGDAILSEAGAAVYTDLFEAIQTAISKGQRHDGHPGQ